MVPYSLVKGPTRNTVIFWSETVLFVGGFWSVVVLGWKSSYTKKECFVDCQCLWKEKYSVDAKERWALLQLAEAARRTTDIEFFIQYTQLSVCCLFQSFLLRRLKKHVSKLIKNEVKSLGSSSKRVVDCDARASFPARSIWIGGRVGGGRDIRNCFRFLKMTVVPDGPLRPHSQKYPLLIQ